MGQEETINRVGQMMKLEYERGYQFANLTPIGRRPELKQPRVGWRNGKIVKGDQFSRHSEPQTPAIEPPAVASGWREIISRPSLKGQTNRGNRPGSAVAARMSAPRIRRLIAESWSAALLHKKDHIENLGTHSLLAHCLLEQLVCKCGASATVLRHYESMQRGLRQLMGDHRLWLFATLSQVNTKSLVRLTHCVPDALEFRDDESMQPPSLPRQDAVELTLAVLQRRLPSEQWSDPNKVDDALTRIMSVEDGAQLVHGAAMAIEKPLPVEQDDLAKQLKVFGQHVGTGGGLGLEMIIAFTVSCFHVQESDLRARGTNSVLTATAQLSADSASSVETATRRPRQKLDPEPMLPAVLRRHLDKILGQQLDNTSDNNKSWDCRTGEARGKIALLSGANYFGLHGPHGNATAERYLAGLRAIRAGNPATTEKYDDNARLMRLLAVIAVPTSTGRTIAHSAVAAVSFLSLERRLRRPYLRRYRSNESNLSALKQHVRGAIIVQQDGEDFVQRLFHLNALERAALELARAFGDGGTQEAGVQNPRMDLTPADMMVDAYREIAIRTLSRVDSWPDNWKLRLLQQATVRKNDANSAADSKLTKLTKSPEKGLRRLSDKTVILECWMEMLHPELFEPHHEIPLQSSELDADVVVVTKPCSVLVTPPDLSTTQTGRLISAVYHAKLQADRRADQHSRPRIALDYFAARHLAHLFGWHPPVHKRNTNRASQLHHAKLVRFWRSVEVMMELDCRCGLFWRLCPTAHSTHVDGVGDWVPPKQLHEIEAELAGDLVMTLLAEAEAVTASALRRAGPLATVTFANVGDVLRVAVTKTMERWKGTQGINGLDVTRQEIKALIVKLEAEKIELSKQLGIEKQIAQMVELASSLPDGSSVLADRFQLPANSGKNTALQLITLEKDLRSASDQLHTLEMRAEIIRKSVLRLDFSKWQGQAVLSDILTSVDSRIPSAHRRRKSYRLEWTRLHKSADYLAQAIRGDQAAFWGPALSADMSAPVDLDQFLVQAICAVFPGLKVPGIPELRSAEEKAMLRDQAKLNADRRASDRTSQQVASADALLQMQTGPEAILDVDMQQAVDVATTTVEVIAKEAQIANAASDAMKMTVVKVSPASDGSQSNTIEETYKGQPLSSIDEAKLQLDVTGPTGAVENLAETERDAKSETSKLAQKCKMLDQSRPLDKQQRLQEAESFVSANGSKDPTEMAAVEGLRIFEEKTETNDLLVNDANDADETADLVQNNGSSAAQTPVETYMNEPASAVPSREPNCSETEPSVATCAAITDTEVASEAGHTKTLTTLEESQCCSDAGSTAAQKFKPSEKTGDDAHGPLQHEQDGFLINDKVKIGTDSLVQSADESSPADQMITVPSAEAPDDEEFTAAVKIQAAQRRKATRKRLLQQLFERLQEFDADKNGFVDSFEMKAYLKVVGLWDSEKPFTDAEWSRSWPLICELVGANDVEQGLSMECFSQYHKRYRGSQTLMFDLREMSRATSTAVVGECPLLSKQSAVVALNAKQTTTVPSAEAVGAPDDEEFTATVKIQAAQRRKATRKRLLQQLFERLQEFDADKNGFVDSFEMKAYLKVVGLWDSEKPFTDAEWSRSWPLICELVGANDVEQGLSMECFSQYHKRYRGSQTLMFDLREMSRATSTAVVGECPLLSKQSAVVGSFTDEKEGRVSFMLGEKDASSSPVFESQPTTHSPYMEELSAQLKCLPTEVAENVFYTVVETKCFDTMEEAMDGTNPSGELGLPSLLVAIEQRRWLRDQDNAPTVVLKFQVDGEEKWASTVDSAGCMTLEHAATLI
eukprot:SAG31_NODE_32_length_32319_cov_28.042681_25_plen_1800_part_00